MIATVLAAGGLDPTVVVGGRVDALGSNARLGRSQYLVAEADESDRSFLKLSPILSVVTNLDREHMDCYRDMEDVEAAFLEFMDRVPFYGACTACVDNPQLAALLPRVHRRVFTYGMSSNADYVLRMLPAMAGVRSRFEVATAGLILGPFELNVPGRHNVLNATAAVAIGTQLEISGGDMASALRGYRGVDRRFQLKGVVRGVTVVDDYGHHPTEIRATLSAARDSGYKQVHVIFQPHRYTRTRDLMEEFCHRLRRCRYRPDSGYLCGQRRTDSWRRCACDGQSDPSQRSAICILVRGSDPADGSPGRRRGCHRHAGRGQRFPGSEPGARRAQVIEARARLWICCSVLFAGLNRLRRDSSREPTTS